MLVKVNCLRGNRRESVPDVTGEIRQQEEVKKKQKNTVKFRVFGLCTV